MEPISPHNTFRFFPNISTSRSSTYYKCTPEERVATRVADIKNLLPESIIGKLETYIDIGGGDSSITIGVAKGLGIDCKNVVINDIFENFTQLEPETCPITYVQTKIDHTKRNVSIALPDNQFDLVTCFVSIHHFSYMDDMFREIVRIMKPGGYLFIREHDVGKSDERIKQFLNEMHLQWEDYQSFIKDLRNKLYKNETYFPKINYFSREGLRKYLSKFNFEIINYGEIQGTKVNNGVYIYTSNKQHLYNSLYQLQSKIQ